MKKAFIAVAFLAALCLYNTGSYAEEKWPGVDETVIEKCAGEHGRQASSCFLDIEGDALLFAFLLAGVAGGFTMGYYYRDLTVKKARDGEVDAR